MTFKISKRFSAFVYRESTSRCHLFTFSVVGVCELMLNILRLSFYRFNSSEIFLNWWRPTGCYRRFSIYFVNVQNYAALQRQAVRQSWTWPSAAETLTNFSSLFLFEGLEIYSNFSIPENARLLTDPIFVRSKLWFWRPRKSTDDDDFLEPRG